MNNGDMPAAPTVLHGEMVTTDCFRDELGSVTHSILEEKRYGGLTKREYFAGLAMQGFIAAGSHGMPPPDEISGRAVECADALLKELDK